MPTKKPELAPPCPMCGIPANRKKIGGRVPGTGKLRVRHKCPHGKWCAQGKAGWGQHSNGRPPPSQSCCAPGFAYRGSAT